MADTITTVYTGQIGGKKFQILNLTADGTSISVPTGLSNVDVAIYTPEATEDMGIVYRNYSDAGSTAAPGTGKAPQARHSAGEASRTARARERMFRRALQ